MSTTIQISDEVKKNLDKMKIFERETYNEILEVMIEDSLELSDEMKKEIEEARMEIKKGQVVSHEEVKRRLGL